VELGRTFRPWSIFVFFKPKKLDLFLAGVLISTVVMDSPLWGIDRIARRLPLWKEHQQTTNNLAEWIRFYYNPIGTSLVWDGGWFNDSVPNAAMIFWSIIGRTFAEFPGLMGSIL
jgi:hypothetical protein